MPIQYKAKRSKRISPWRILSYGGLAVVAVFFTSTLLDLRHRRSAEGDLVRAGAHLYQAMERYTLHVGHYPSSGDPLEEVLDPATLEPLVREGALRSPDPVTDALAGGRIAVYCSPDLPSRNHDFWALLVSGKNDNVKVLVADTDEYPGMEGEPLRGIFLLRGDRWVPQSL